MTAYFDTAASLAYLQSTRPVFSSLGDAIDAPVAFRHSPAREEEAAFRSHTPDFEMAERHLASSNLPSRAGDEEALLIAPTIQSCRHLSHRRLSQWTGAVPRGSFIRASQGVYLCSPEFCFLKLAHVLSPMAHVELGYRLCGYGSLLNDADDDDAFDQPRFWARATTVDLLKRYLEGAGGAYGVKRARRSLRLVTDGSASPIEGKMATLVRSPMAMGGYGVRNIKLNARISASNKARELSGMRSFIPDLRFVGSKVVLEYDGDMGHFERRKRTRDANRREGLEMMGFRVIVLTYDQLSSQWAMNRVMHDVASQVGLRFRSPGYDHVERRIRLHLELFGKA